MCFYWCPAAKEVEVAAVLRLQDVLLVHSAVASTVCVMRFSGQRVPLRTSLRQFRGFYEKIEPSLRQVDLDIVTGPNERQRPADR